MCRSRRIIPFKTETSGPLCKQLSGFLAVNRIEMLSEPEALYEAMIRLTTSHWDKGRFAEFLRSHSRTAEQ